MRWILLLIPCVWASNRVVLTFDSWDLASQTYDLNATVVKQYGRRLVLDLGREYNREEDDEWLRSQINQTIAIEEDVKIKVEQNVLDFNDLYLDIEDPSTLDGLRVMDWPETTTPIFDIQTTPPPPIESPTIIDTVYAAVVDSGAPQPTNPVPWNLADAEPYSIKVEGVWKKTNSTPDVVVAVVDSGIAQSAKSAFLNLLPGYDFISDVDIAGDGNGRDPDSTDNGAVDEECPVAGWHGTKVASILAAKHTSGVYGVAQNCSVLPIRVLGLCSEGYANDITDAIVWAVGGTINGVAKNLRPAKIISLSLAGSGACPSYLQSAINQAHNLGATIVAAAGNEGLPTIADTFPANCLNVISVGAITRKGTLASYSNIGANVLAPGGDIWNAILLLSIDVNLKIFISYGAGTSMAVPHVSGKMALSFLLNNNYTNQLSVIPYERVSGAACPAGTMDLNGCPACDAGKYSVYGWGHCEPCSAGKTSTLPITSYGDVCTDCPAGKYSVKGEIWGAGTLCQGCPLGKYTDTAGSSSCISCTSPRTTYEIGSTGCRCPYGTMWPFDCAVCGDGKYTIPGWGHCSPCPAGTSNTQPQSMDGSGACNPCPAGSYSYEGTEWFEGTICRKCPIGKYSATSGASTCTDCVSPLTTVFEGSTGCRCPNGTMHLAGCPACTAGKYTCCAWGHCSPCPAGTSSVAPLTEDGQQVCTPCPAGSYSTLGTEWFDGSLCKKCPIGSYSAAIGSTTCTSCTNGQTTQEEGATGCRCLPGTMWLNGCPACDAGKYSVWGWGHCEPCPAGTSSVLPILIDGSGVCNPCSAGEYSVRGSIWGVGTLCKSCSRGFISNTTGATTCLTCAAGYYADNMGSTTCSLCSKACDVNEFMQSNCTGPDNRVCCARYYKLSLFFVVMVNVQIGYVGIARSVCIV
jgi:subtilisin family serine protease